MDYLRRLLFSFRERRRPAALSASSLNRVPVEILLHIRDYLPLESAVAFSLSCMHLKRVLGLRHFLQIASSVEKTNALLNLIALDLPNHIACSACKKLHSMQNMRRYSSATDYSGSTTFRYRASRLPDCVSQDHSNNTHAVSSLFGATGFKMAMKRYHHQPDCTKLLDIMSSHAVQTVQTGDYMRQFREECRIIQGSLMHRLQSVHISRKSSSATSFTFDRPLERVCPHIRFREVEHHIGAGAQRCQECRTEYRIDVKYYDDHGLAMFFTRWKDLGTGPEDAAWTEHLPKVKSLRALFENRGQARMSGSLKNQREIRLQNGDLSSAFEESRDFEFDSLLTPRNMAELFRVQK